MAVVHAAQGYIEARAPASGPNTLPDGDSLRIASIGHTTSVADLFWLKLVQYVGSQDGEAEEWPNLEPLANLVVTIDPYYGYAYEASGVLLASAGRIEASNSILERGIENVPNRWQLPFFAGFNRWSVMGDLDRGAELVLQASKLPGSPRYLPELAARLFSSAGTLEDGIAALDLALDATADPHLRDEISKRRDQMRVELALRRLEAAIATYRDRHDAMPASLLALESPQAQRIAASALAKEIRFDAATGAVSSPLLPRRLLLYLPAKVPETLAAP